MQFVPVPAIAPAHFKLSVLNGATQTSERDKRSGAI